MCADCNIKDGVEVTGVTGQEVGLVKSTKQCFEKCREVNRNYAFCQVQDAFLPGDLLCVVGSDCPITIQDIMRKVVKQCCVND
jgi:hypothetical protein